MLDEAVDMAAAYSLCCNLSLLVEAWKGKGTHYTEYYGLPINQQPRNKEENDPASRPQFKVSTRDLGKPRWTGTDKNGRSKCKANPAQFHLGLAIVVIWVWG